MLIYESIGCFKSISVIWNILRPVLSVDKMVQRVWLNKLIHVKLSHIVAIRTTFRTNHFWNKVKYCVYLLFSPSKLFLFFFFFSTSPSILQKE